MTTSRTTAYLVDRVCELRKLPRETEWVKLKQNDADPKLTGEYLSALANVAALEGKALLWLAPQHVVAAPSRQKKSRGNKRGSP